MFLVLKYHSVSAYLVMGKYSAVCVFITASLSGVFTMNRLQMLLRIQK